MPCDMKKYPPEWKQIRAAVLDRACDTCEICGVANYAIGYRNKYGEFVEVEPEQAEVDALVDGEKRIKIVLTIAHMDDPDPMNCNPDNLKALCQRCHNRLDAPMRAKNAAKTRLAKKAAGSLFEEASQ